MSKIFESQGRKVKMPVSGHALAEFDSGKKGIAICGECDAAYYKKFWHQSLLNLKSAKEDAPVNCVLCPACKMIKNGQFEGRITISGAPQNSMAELLNLIRGFGERARIADPMDRVIEAKKNKDSIIVTTTENQLANKLAKKIQSTFNKVKSKTTFSKDPSDFVDIRVEFLSS